LYAIIPIKGEKQKMKKRVLLCVLIFLIPVVSQAKETGRIQGLVRKANKSIGGVDVFLEELSLSRMTDNNGSYSFNDIPPGKYTLIFTLGENSVTREDIVVTANTTTPCEVDVEWEILLAHSITVHGVSRKTERIVDAPAAVTVLEEAEIEREAAHGQLPKILETTLGVDSTQSGLYDFNFNARGYNTSLNRRILTLIDSVDMSAIFLGAQAWPLVSSLLPDVASMEMIRGPGSALYGANAYNGVFNINSKDSRYSQGGFARLTIGELETTRLDLRYAGNLGKNWYFTLLGGYMQSDDFTQSRNESVEYESLPLEVFSLSPGKLKTYNAKIRLDKHFESGSVLTLESWLIDHEGFTIVTGSGRIQNKDIPLPLARLNFKSSHWNILAYGYTMDWQGTSLSSGVQLLSDMYKLYGEVQGFTNFAGEKGRIVGGFSLRREGADTADENGNQTLLSKARDEHMEAVFGQIDYNFTDKLKLVFAGRLDFSSLHDTMFSPKGALVYSFNPGHSLRLTLNRAFQTPNYVEFFLRLPVSTPVDLSAIEEGLSAALGGMDLGLGFESVPVLALGNENLNVEEVTSYEIGYSNILGRKLLFNLNYYRSQFKNFVTDILPLVNPAYGPYAPPSNLPPLVQAAILATLENSLPPSLFAIMSNSLEDESAIFAGGSYTNVGEANAQGIELGLKYYLSEQWHVDFNYAWFDFVVKEELVKDRVLANAPEHRANLRVVYISDWLDVSMQYRWVDSFPWATGIFIGDVKSYNLVDLSANIYFGDGFSLGINISNLLNNKHYQSFGGDMLRRRAVTTFSYRW
jgi:outer membrane receptor for ferrienterochelin and colicins